MIFAGQRPNDERTDSIELIDPSTKDERTVHMEKYTYGNELRLLKQTVPISLAIEAAEYFAKFGYPLPEVEWTFQRDYGG